MPQGSNSTRRTQEGVLVSSLLLSPVGLDMSVHSDDYLREKGAELGFTREQVTQILTDDAMQVVDLLMKMEEPLNVGGPSFPRAFAALSGALAFICHKLVRERPDFLTVVFEKVEKLDPERLRSI